MKRILIIIIGLITLSLDLYSSEPEKVFNEIFNDLKNTIDSSKTKNQYVEKCFNLVYNSFIKEEISAVYDSTLNNGISGCCKIEARGNYTDITFYFGDFIVETYKKHPSIIKAIFIHEFQHIYDMKTKPKLVKISKNNQIEELYFEIDALYIEALFIENYIEPKTNLSPLEKYLYNDLQNHMAGVATLIKMADIDLVHKMDKYRDSNSSYEDTIKEFEQLGKSTHEEYKINVDDSNWSKYCKYVTLISYVRYCNQVVFDIASTKGKVEISPSEFNLSDYPNITKVIDEISEHLKDYENILDYRKAVLNNFYNYYK